MDINRTSLLTLPREVILHIILMCRVYGWRDWIVLRNIAGLCKYINSLMTVHRREIVEHYTMVMVRSDITEYIFCGMLHRENDLPAVITTKVHNNSYWYKFGMLHRDNDRPASMVNDGRILIWYQHGKKHRDNDKPAVLQDDGSMCWYHRDNIHRYDDLPATIITSGLFGDMNDIMCQQWYYHGIQHRDNDLPAEIWESGTQIWYKYGNYHREGGKPAIVKSSGKDQYYIEGTYISSKHDT